MFRRIIQSLNKSHQSYPKNRTEMGGGHDNSPFIPYHIFGVSKIPNTPATEIYCMGWNQGSACACTYPLLHVCTLFLPLLHFLPIKAPLVHR